MQVDEGRAAGLGAAGEGGNEEEGDDAGAALEGGPIARRLGGMPGCQFHVCMHHKAWCFLRMLLRLHALDTFDLSVTTCTGGEDEDVFEAFAEEAEDEDEEGDYDLWDGGEKDDDGGGDDGDGGGGAGREAEY